MVALPHKFVTLLLIKWRVANMPVVAVAAHIRR